VKGKFMAEKRVSTFLYRLWQKVRPSLGAAASQRRGLWYSVAGSLLAVAVVLSRLNLYDLGPVADWAGLILTLISLFAAGFYFLDARLLRLATRRAPAPDPSIRALDFQRAPTKLDTEYRLARPADSSREQLYPYMDLSHHEPFIAGENPDLTRAQRLELYQRWYGFCPDGFMHLEKKVENRWRPISVSIMLRLSDEGYRAITHRRPRRRVSVIDLDENDILGEYESNKNEKGPVVLIDTWIVDRNGYGGAGHGKTDQRGGNANLLVLRHVAQFWNSATGFPVSMTFVVETANQRLVPSLIESGFQESGDSNIGEKFYVLNPGQFHSTAAANTFAVMKAEVQEIEKVAVDTGTSPAPPDWYYR
jgi:hypothetical protein